MKTKKMTTHDYLAGQQMPIRSCLQASEWRCRTPGLWLLELCRLCEMLGTPLGRGRAIRNAAIRMLCVLSDLHPARLRGERALRLFHTPEIVGWCSKRYATPYGIVALFSLRGRSAEPGRYAPFSRAILSANPLPNQRLCCTSWVWAPSR